jgi:hypothetical protein
MKMKFTTAIVSVLALTAVLFFKSNPQALETVLAKIKHHGDIELVYDPLDGEIVGPVTNNLHRITSGRDVVGREIPVQLYGDIDATGVRVDWIPVPGSDPLRRAATEKSRYKFGQEYIKTPARKF